MLTSKQICVAPVSEKRALRLQSPQNGAKTFIDVVGRDRPMRYVTRTDVRAFRQHLLERIVGEEIEIDTANKIIGHVSRMFVTINEINQYRLPDIFGKARISGGKHKQHVAFDADSCRRPARRTQRRGARPLIYLVAATGPDRQ